MKNLLTFSLALLAACNCLAQTTRLDSTAGNLDIPCVALYRNAAPVMTNGSPTTYKVQLKAAAGNRFTLGSVTPSAPVDECLASYDSASRVYTDIVNVADNAFQVAMKLGDDGAFSLTSANAAGAAKTSLWVASKGANKVYVAGAIYAMRASDYPVPKAFDEAYAKASVMVFETDRDDPAETGANLTQAQAVALMKDAQGKRLSEVLHPDVYALLVNYLTLKKIVTASVEPWSAQMLMNVLPVEDVNLQVGATAKGFDTYLVDKAKADGKTIVGLETADSQRAMLQTINEGLENELVLTTLQDLITGKSATELLALLSAWRLGDMSVLQSSVDSVRTQNRKDYDLVNTDRNLAWTAKIELMLDTPETEMIVVGATHVAGPEGLITLLKNRGYTVTKY